ncbi:MAG: AIPR family protein [Pseudomonadota bacterium]
MRRKSGDLRAQKPRAKNETVEAALRDFAALLGVDLDAIRPHERDAVFERFAALHILRRHAPDLAIEDLNLVSTGDVDDNQLDAVAFITDSQLLGDKIAVMERLEEGEPLDLEIIAVQVTRSKRFDRTKIGSFNRGVHSFLSTVGFFKENPRLAQSRALKDFIIRECAARDVPLRLRVRGYYAADSALPVEGNVLGEFAQGRSILRGVVSVDEAEVEPVDRRRLADIVAVDRSALAYAPALAAYSGYAPTQDLVRLPTASGAAECWLGAVDLASFFLLLTRDDGQGLREGIFEHNVRGFLSETDVNARIKDTLMGEGRTQFPLLNNGVTIVAETILQEQGPIGGAGPRLRLTNYQVVNGLQTTHVLHAARDELGPEAERLFVPVKLVATEDEALRRQIVDATNRQNPIQGLALHVNDPKVLEIQDCVRLREARAAGEWPMIFERRRGLAPEQPRLVGAQKVDLGEMLRSFVAVFLEQPHLAESGLSPTLNLIGAKVLSPDHAPEAYVVSGLLLAQSRRYLERRTDHNLAAEIAAFEHHLSFAIRMLIEPEPLLAADAPRAAAYCAALERRILRPELAEPIFERALDTVRAARRRLPRSRYKRPMESAALTKQVAAEAYRLRAAY